MQPAQRPTTRTRVILLQTLLVSVLGLSVFTATAGAADEYPREQERAQMLAAINGVKPQTLQIDFLGTTGSRERAFLDIFRNEYWPMVSYMGTLSEKSSLYSVAADRALFKDDAEKKEWQDAEQALDNESNQLRTSNKRHELIERMGAAAQGLNGDLATFARRSLQRLKESSFSEKELPLLNRVTELELKIREIANNSPVAPHLAEYSKLSDRIEQEFHAGKIGFVDATQQLDALRTKGPTAMGQDIALRGRELFKEVAILRTRLAQSKGFPNWAEFQVFNKEELYADGFKTAGARIIFLKDVLTKTKDSHRAFLQQRIQDIPDVPAELKNDFGKLRGTQASLFWLPTDALLLDYFPVENVEAVWRKTMLESGFTSTAVNRIKLDNYPRVGKQTHAYMANVRSHEPHTFIVNAKTLNVAIPRQVPGNWSPALIYIVQNMRSDGPGYFSTGFHEGGHALDYGHRQDVLGHGQDSSYSETHSMTMEKFFSDREFLLATGRKRNGERISAETVDRYLANEATNKLVSFRTQAFNALFDLEIWNHAYVEGGEDYVSRSARLQGELADQYQFSKEGRVTNGIDARYSFFSTGHFYGGLVRYIGYVYAEMAAEMNFKHLLDTFEKTTGRRTLLHQPSMAKLLIEGYYKRGFNEPFPGATEKFTGTKFDASKTAGLLTQSVDQWVAQQKSRTCSALFSPAI